MGQEQDYAALREAVSKLQKPTKAEIVDVESTISLEEEPFEPTDMSSLENMREAWYARLSSTDVLTIFTIKHNALLHMLDRGATDGEIISFFTASDSETVSATRQYLSEHPGTVTVEMEEDMRNGCIRDFGKPRY